MKAEEKQKKAENPSSFTLTDSQTFANPSLFPDFLSFLLILSVGTKARGLRVHSGSPVRVQPAEERPEPAWGAAEAAPNTPTRTFIIIIIFVVIFFIIAIIVVVIIIAVVVIFLIIVIIVVFYGEKEIE